MTHADSAFHVPSEAKSRPSNRDNNRDIPVLSSDGEGDCAIAGLSLDVVADVFLIHRRQFDAIGDRRKGEVSRARQVAIRLAVDLGGLSMWRASKAFGVDLSTAKNACARAAERAAKGGVAARRYLEARARFAVELEALCRRAVAAADCEARGS